MPNDASMNSWHEMDEQPVPVRAGTAAPKSQPENIVAPVTKVQPETVAPITKVQPSFVTETVTHTAPVNPSMMKWSAFSGVAIVLIVLGLYFGFGSLRGELTGTGGTAITITADGHFSPTNVSLAAGTILTITNAHQDPQVLKVKQGAELFPVQVLFDTPYTFAVPVQSSGTFTYFSETLPDSETLRITVTPAVEAAAVSSSTASQVASSAFPDIPLPFGSGPVTPANEIASSNPASPAISTDTLLKSSSEQKTDAPIVFGIAPSSSAPVRFATDSLPTNPYTVDSLPKENNDQQLAMLTETSETLHGGAPLMEYRPKTVTKTGSELWLALVPALFGMLFVYKKFGFNF